MKEPYASKYVLAEDSTLENILKDWDYLQSKFIPQIEAFVQKKVLISFKDVMKLINEDNVTRNSLFNDSLLQKYINNDIGLIFYHFDDILNINFVKKNEYCVKFLFPSGIDCNTCRITMIPIETSFDLFVDNKIKQLNQEKSIFNLYFYKMMIKQSECFFVGFHKNKKLRYFNFYFIFNGYLYLLEYSSINVSILHMEEILKTIEFFETKKKKYKFGKISFLYPPKFKIKSKEIIGGNEIILSENDEQMIILFEKSTEDENLSDPEEETISEKRTIIFNVEAQYIEFKKGETEYSMFKFKLQNIQYQFTFNNLKSIDDFDQIIKTMTFENTEKELILNLILDTISQLENGCEIDHLNTLHPLDKKNISVLSNFKTHERISELKYHLKLEFENISKIDDLKIERALNSKIYDPNTLVLFGKILTYRSFIVDEKSQWFLSLSKTK
eukprot:gene717-8969_t